MKSTTKTNSCLSLDMLKSYMSESLSVSQRKIAEEHLLDCPFCSDTLEGMSKVSNKSNIETTVHHINQLIKERAGNSPAFVFGGWIMKVAGVVLLVALGGGAYYWFNNSSSENSLEKNVSVSTTENKVSTQTAIDKSNAVVSANSTLPQNDASNSVAEKSELKNNSSEVSKLKRTNNKENQPTASALSKDKSGISNDKNINAENKSANSSEKSSNENESIANDKNKTEANIPVLADAKPEFPGGESKLFEFVQKNLQYPAVAKKAGVQGQVYVSFVINKDGSIGDIKIVKGLSKELDEEAIRVVRTMPNWKPAIKKSEKAPATYNLIVTFSL